MCIRDRERVVDEKIERGGTVFTATIPDMRDKLLHKAVIIDRLWFQPLFLAVFDVFKLGVIQRHFVPHEKLSAALYCRTGSPDRPDTPVWGGNSLAAITADAAALPAGASAKRWNLSPDERAGQPGVCPVAVTLYIAPIRPFFQLEIGVLR